MRRRALKQIWQAVRQLNAESVRQLAERPIYLGLLASSERTYEEMVAFVGPINGGMAGTPARIIKVERPADFERCDFGFAEPHRAHPAHLLKFQRA